MSSAKTLLGIFGTTDFIVPLVLQDLTDDQARRRARGDSGPSIAWTVGHMLHYRHNALALLGRPQNDPYAERFGTVGATDGTDYPAVAELLEQWKSISTALTAVVSQAPEKTFDAPVKGGPHAEESVRDKLAFIAFHEGYHMGALGAVRKSLGLLGPAEKVMALAAQNG
jgi:uncharacterized damage-inducible protein DinB